jgi:hypothetical protein
MAYDGRSSVSVWCEGQDRISSDERHASDVTAGSQATDWTRRRLSRSKPLAIGARRLQLQERLTGQIATNYHLHQEWGSQPIVGVQSR